jgi:uncharacterized protein YjbJ (UPF0337 family)
MSDSIWNQIAGNWKQWIGNAQERWGKLTDDDIAEARGDRNQLVGKIQERYGIAQAEAERQVDEWAANIKARI